MTQQPATGRSRYSLGSSSNLVRSMLVILGLVAVLVAVVPRTTSVPRPSVDAASVAKDAAQSTGLALLVPEGLPSGWTATTAQLQPTTDQILTWQTGWTTPDDGFVLLRQAKDVSPSWISAATTQGTVVGSEQLAGRTWEKRYDATHDQTSLVDQQPSLTTVVTAKGDPKNLTTFVDALKPAAG